VWWHLPTVLKIHVAHRQRNHRKARAGNLVERGLDGVVRLSGQRTAMADQDLAFETMAQRGIGDAVKRNCIDIVGLVGVKIEIKTQIDGLAEHAIQQCIESGTM
jgi:hypothetical protein